MYAHLKSVLLKITLFLSIYYYMIDALSDQHIENRRTSAALSISSRVPTVGPSVYASLGIENPRTISGTPLNPRSGMSKDPQETGRQRARASFPLKRVPGLGTVATRREAKSEPMQDLPNGRTYGNHLYTPIRRPSPQAPLSSAQPEALKRRKPTGGIGKNIFTAKLKTAKLKRKRIQPIVPPGEDPAADSPGSAAHAPQREKPQKNPRSGKSFFALATLRIEQSVERSKRPLIAYSLIPIVGFLALAVYFFFFSPFAWPYEGARLAPIEDTIYRQNMASYAGLGSPTSYNSQGEDIPLDLMETFAWQTYRVREGDSVSRIAANHSLSMDAIIAANGMTNARRLIAGQDIRIPNMDGIPYTVKSGDSYSRIAVAHGVPLSAILDANDIESDVLIPGTQLFLPGVRMKTEDLKLALGELFLLPIQGRLTSNFGWRNDPINGVRRYHAAIDVAAPRGTAVRSAMEGRVSSVGYNASYGNFIILSHSNSYQTMYAHLSKIVVSRGDYVQQGIKIGEVGSTGYSTGNHLHFAVYKNGRAVNPLEYLNL